jgi:hypothetical protein
VAIVHYHRTYKRHCRKVHEDSIFWLECETKDEEGERLEGQTLKFKLERETSAQIRNMIYTLMQQAKSK